MATINLVTALFTLAKAKLQLEVAACASLNGPDPLLNENADLLTTDIWMQKGHNLHFSFNVSFNGLFPDPGAANEDSIAAFMALILTQAPLWSQLPLVACFVAQNHNINGRRVNGRTLIMKLEQNDDLDFDITNVKPPPGISVFSLASVQVSLTFSPITSASKKSTRLSNRASPKFEDLLGQRHGHKVLELDLETPGWQHLKDQAFEGYESTLDIPSYSPEPLLCGQDHLPENPKNSVSANPGSLCFHDSSFQSLETCDLIFASEPRNLPCRLQGDLAFSAETPSFLRHEIGAPAASSPISTFESLRPGESSVYHSTAKETSYLPSSPKSGTPVPLNHRTSFHEAILALIDTALRTLIHPHPTRLPAGIKPTQTDFALNSQTTQQNTNPISLSDLAPSIFTPNYARGVAERASLVPSIAKSLATFLKFRAGSGAGAGAEADDAGSQIHGNGDGAQEAHEDLKELLRGHVWMTMTNGLRISHAEKARRLRPLVLPDQWRGGDRVEGLREAEDEMLDEAFLPEVSYYMGEERREEVAILEELEEEEEEEEEGRREDSEEDTEQELLFDDEQVDLSFLEEEFEELCLFERCAVGSAGVAVLEKCTMATIATIAAAAADDDDDDDDGMEEMLF